MTSLELKAQELAYRRMADVVWLSRISLIKRRIKDGTYDETSPLPLVADRLADTLDQGRHTNGIHA
jgi:hypothetical protein